MLTATPTPAITRMGPLLMTNEGTKRVRNKPLLRAFCTAMGTFRELSPTMPVGEVQMFLLVALNEGASLTELAEEGDMKKSTASRYLLDLSDKTRSGDAGYGLITREPDPEELRRNMYALTDKGRKIVSSLVGAGSTLKSVGD